MADVVVTICPPGVAVGAEIIGSGDRKQEWARPTPEQMFSRSTKKNQKSGANRTKGVYHGKKRAD